MKKKGCNWLFMSHEDVQPADVVSITSLHFYVH